MKWSEKRKRAEMPQKFINILPTIVAIWFALWPQRARDALPAISADDAASAATPWRRDEMRWDEMMGTRAVSDEAGAAAAHDRKQEIRVNFASCTPHAARRCTGWPKGLHNSFHLWQDINQCGQRAEAASCWEVVAKLRQVLCEWYMISLIFCPLFCFFFFLLFWTACKTSLLPKSFVFLCRTFA